MRRHAPFVAIGACVAGAVFAVSPSRPDDYDGVLLVLGLRRFDPLALRPQWPGYGVFMAIAHAARALGASEITALLVPGLIALVALPLALGRLARRLSSEISIWPALVLALATPMLWHEATRAHTGILGATLILLALAFADVRGRRVAVAGVALGLAGGADPDLALVVVPLFVWLARAGWRPALLGVVGGGLIWLVPTLAATGLRAFIDAGALHLSGHVQTYGGTVIGDASGGSARLASWWQTLAAAGLTPSFSLWAAIPGGLIALGVGALRVGTLVRRHPSAALAGAPALAWLALFQHPEHGRHLLVPAAFVAVLVATSLWPRASAPAAAAARPRDGARIRRILYAVVLATWGALAGRALTTGAVLPPALAATTFVREHFAAQDVVFLGSRSSAFLRLQAPEFLAPELGHTRDVAAIIATIRPVPPVVLVTSELEFPADWEVVGAWQRPALTPGRVESLRLARAP